MLLRNPQVLSGLKTKKADCCRSTLASHSTGMKHCTWDTTRPWQ